MALRKAIAKLETFFAGRDSRPGVLARRLLGQSHTEDARLSQLICNAHQSQARMDGSIHGSLVDTAWAAWEMMDLGLDALNASLSRLVHWVLQQVEAQPDPLPPADSPLTLANGAVLSGTTAASFAAHCLGLRVLLRARQDVRPGVSQRVDALAGEWPPFRYDLAACALGTLALAATPHRERLPGFVQQVGEAQGKDGTWSNVNLFHMLEALLLAGIRPARDLIVKSVPALVSLQREDGSFDEEANEERALIGLNALLVAQEG
jgi:hypothetical protein